MATKHHPEHHSEPVLESAMDYAEHEKTYGGFIGAVKYSIISMAILLVGLYFIVINHQPILGGVLVLASVVVPAFMAIVSRK